jgi:hypothetical protein
MSALGQSKRVLFIHSVHSDAKSCFGTYLKLPINNAVRLGTLPGVYKPQGLVPHDIQHMTLAR